MPEAGRRRRTQLGAAASVEGGRGRRTVLQHERARGRSPRPLRVVCGPWRMRSVAARLPRGMRCMRSVPRPSAAAKVPLRLEENARAAACGEARPQTRHAFYGLKVNVMMSPSDGHAIIYKYKLYAGISRLRLHAKECVVNFGSCSFTHSSLLLLLQGGTRHVTARENAPSEGKERGCFTTVES